MTTKGPQMISLSTASNFADIIFVEFETNLQVDLETAEQIVAKRLSFANNKKHYLVLDMSNVRAVTAQAKKYLQAPDGGLKHILGAALIATNPVAAMIANVFIKTPKDFQAKFFNNRGDAFEWVCKQRHRRQQPPPLN